MKNKALKRSLLIVPASVPLIGLVLPLSLTTSSNNVSSKTITGASWTFDQVNTNVQDNIWKNYNSLPNSNHNARYAPYRYINIFNSNGNLDFNDGNANWQYPAVGDSWFRLFDASNPGFPNNVNVSDWIGDGYATESGTLYSWQVDGFSNKNVDYGPWWNGNGYNPDTDTKRFKIGYNLINKPLHGSASQGAQSTFYTGAFYFSNDMKLASDIKIHLYIKVDDRNNSTVLQQKTYTIKLKEEKNATLSDYDISPWIGKVQKVNKDSLQASQSGDRLEAWLTNYAYLPYYQNTPTSYTNGLSADLLNKKRTWDNLKTSDKHNGMYDILVSTPTNMSDIRSRGFQLSNSSGSWVNFGLFQKNLIRNDSRPADIIYNNQGGLFVFNIEMNRKLDYLVAGAVAEAEFEPYNDVANPSNTTFFGNTGSSTTKKSFFGSAEYREKNDDTNQRIVSGFWKIADRSESQLKKFYTIETIDLKLSSDIYNPNSDAFPTTTLRITENENSDINYDISKSGITNRNKRTISTKSIYQDTKAVRNTNALRLTSTISSADVQKWKVKSGSSVTARPISSNRFDSNGIEFIPIIYTYTDLELAKRHVDTKKWLNKKQKDNLKMQLDNESGFNASNQYSKDTLLTEWKTKIDILDENARIKDYTATFDYPNKNIQPTSAEQNLVSQKSISPDANGLETEIISIKGNNDTRTLTVTYRIVKSSDKTNVYTQNKTYDITDFANEQNIVNNLNATPDYKDVSQKPNIQASAVVNRNKNAEDITWVVPERTQIYPGSVRYLGYNDITGKIKIAYKLQSTTDASAISNEKTAEITGFEKESTRLNNLVKQDTNTNQKTILNISANPIKRASDSTLNTDYRIALANNYGTTNQVELTDLSSPTANDTNGSVSYTYKLKTTREANDLVTIADEIPSNVDIKSNASASQTRTGFLTQAQYEQNQRDAKKRAIDNYQYLNNAQKNAIKEAIQNAPIEQLDQKVTDANDLNNAMKAYIEATNNIDTIKQGIDYTEADNQSALDSAVNQQKTDVNKTQGSNLSLTEVKNRTKAIQDAISNLNGEERLQKAKNDAIAKVNSDYSSLTDKQKEKAIALI
ncbi:GA module-containing protein, partial [Mycoplasmopsis gallinarum]|uniref:GA module-containing protein n=1 Tax=Mycoplasmopsis gallinarum TaxID=29557 RepID=UPI000A94186A